MWTEVTTRDGHRAWTAWDAEQADCGALVVLEYDPEWVKPWVASVLGPTVRDGISATPDGALRLAGCGLPAPDTLPRTLRRDAEGSEPDDRPVMAWWGPVDGGCYRWGLSTDPHGTVRTMRSQGPHPARYAEAMGWRAVEVPRD